MEAYSSRKIGTAFVLNAGTTALTTAIPVAEGGALAAALVSEGLGKVRDAAAGAIDGVDTCE